MKIITTIQSKSAPASPIPWLFSLAALLATSGFGQNIGAWTKATALPVIQSEWDGVTIGDSLFVVGGEMKRTPQTDPSKASDELWIYNGKTAAWTQGANMPGGRNHHAVALLDGKLYVLGGYSFSCCGNYPWPYGNTNNWRYDPKTNAWTVLAPLPRRMGAGMAAAFDGRIYVFAGTDTGAFNSNGSVQEYDPAANAWRARASMRNAREHVKGAVVDSLIYLIGGHQKPEETKINQPSVEAYAPRSNRWYDKGNMPVPRGGIGAAYLGGKIYVFGGEGANYTLFNRVDQYDPATGAWAQVNSTPSGGGIHGLATMVMGERIHLVGGASPAGFNPRNYHDVFTPPTVDGCTNPAAGNFNRYATRDNGTCQATSAGNDAPGRGIVVQWDAKGLRITGLSGESHRITLLDTHGRVWHRADVRGESHPVPAPERKGIHFLRIEGGDGSAWNVVPVFR